MKNLIIISAISVAAVGIATQLTGDVSSHEVHVVTPRKVTEHYNINLVLDLSNRIDKPKPVNDLDIIGLVFNDIEQVYLKSQNRKTNQQDRFKIAFTNQSLITQHQINTDNLILDFSRFKNQMVRIKYVNGTNKEDNLNKDISKLNEEIQNTYIKARTNIGGADIPSFLKGLNKAIIKPKGSLEERRRSSGKVYLQEYRNVVILLTDGYIEADQYANNYTTEKVYPNLSGERINAYRNHYEMNSQGRSLKQFFEDEGYGITPVDNPLLAETEILVLEIDDRSKNAAGNATEMIEDYDIIKLFWSDWLNKSGVKRFELHAKANTISEVKSHIKDFIR